jgi:hypothetical protein
VSLLIFMDRVEDHHASNLFCIGPGKHADIEATERLTHQNVWRFNLRRVQQCVLVGSDRRARLSDWAGITPT